MRNKRRVLAVLFVLLAFGLSAALAETEATQGEATPAAQSELVQEETSDEDVAEPVPEDPCKHEPYPSVEENDEDIIEYTPLDERQHTVKGIIRWRLICTNCRETLDSDNRPFERAEAHDFDASGKCKLCGYQCAHPSYTSGNCDICGYAHQEHSFEVRAGSGGESGVPESVCTVCGYVCAYHHWRSNTDGYSGVCTVCGYACPHSFNSANGSCDICSYFCPHTEWREGVCTNCGYHCVHVWRSETDEYSGVCTVCGYACPHSFNSADGYCGTCYYQCPHPEWNEGVCTVCGYSCYHYWWTENGEATGVCQTCGLACQHTWWTNGYGYTGVCSTCFYACPHSLDANGHCTICDYQCPHTWYKDGVCVNCGYACPHFWWSNDGVWTDVCLICKYQCPHENMTRNTYQEYIGEPVQNSDGLTHGRMLHNVTYSNCPTCYGYWREVEEPGTPVVEPHIFSPDAFGNSICVICGYGCPHANTRQYINQLMRSCTPNDDGLTHTRVYEYIQVTSCNDCNRIISEVSLYTSSSTGRHSYDSDDENGECWSCGFPKKDGPVSQCAHENKVYIYDYDYDSASVFEIRDDGHVLAYKVVHEVRCADCDARLDILATDEIAYESEKHYYDENGRCRGCGFEKASALPCEHPESARRTSISSYGSSGYTFYDELYHQERIETEYVSTYCDLCGEWLSSEEVKVNGVVSLQRHTFRDGFCTNCGYVKGGVEPCKHEHTRTDRYFDWGDRYAIADEETGMSNYVIIEEVYCEDCGATLNSKQLPMETGRLPKVDHDNSEYEPCTHPTTSTYTTHSSINKVVPGEAGHVLHARNLYRYTVCEECGAQLNREFIGEDETYFEPHKFEYGKCTVCGLSNPCEHAHTEDEVHYELERNGVSEGAQTHSFLGDRVTETTCLDCGEKLHTEREIDVTVTGEPHTFRKGFCTVCGEPEPGTSPAPSTSPEPSATPKPTPAEADTPFVPTPKPTPALEAGSSGNGGNNGGGSSGGYVASPGWDPVRPEATTAPREMVKTLLDAVEAAQDGAATVDVEVVGAREVMTGEEYAALRTLPAQEQVLVTLTAIGMGDAVEAATRTLGVALSADAQALSGGIAARMAAATDADRAALALRLAMYFPKATIVESGVVCDYFCVTLEVTVDGTTTTYRYGFRYDAALGEWVFVLMNAE